MMLSSIILPFAFFATFATAASLFPGQTPLSRERLAKTLPGPQSSSNLQLDPAPGTVGLYLPEVRSYGSADPDTFWLPLGRRVYLRDNPLLPMHPSLGRVSQVIDGQSTRVELRSIVCTIYPVATRQSSSELSSQIEDARPKPITLRAGDGLVDFHDDNEDWYLGGREVESYKCS